MAYYALSALKTTSEQKLTDVVKFLPTGLA